VRRITRRSLLLATLKSQVLCSAAQSAKPLSHRGEFTQFADALTEAVVTRLTSPSSSALLPSAQNRFISAKDRFLVFSSDRGGAFAPYHLDLRTGVLLQLTETPRLDPKSLALDATDRNLLFLDSGSLYEYSLPTKRMRTVTEDISGFSLAREVRGEVSSIVVLRQGKVQDLRGGVLASGVSAGCLLSPDGSAVLLQRGTQPNAELWSVPTRSTGGPSRERLLAKGPITCPFWTADGQKIIFLREAEIRQVSVPAGTEELVARTSLFAAFSPNRDDSVFVGASRSKATPAVVLLVRAGHHELTLCEHRAKQPAAVSPVFSPDSRRVYFQSDHLGNPAIYSVNIESFVEPT
jgi:oligogalacturonide lyase